MRWHLVVSLAALHRRVQLFGSCSIGLWLAVYAILAASKGRWGIETTEYSACQNIAKRESHKQGRSVKCDAS